MESHNPAMFQSPRVPVFSTTFYGSIRCQWHPQSQVAWSYQAASLPWMQCPRPIWPCHTLPPGVHSPRKTHRGFARHVIHTAIFTAQLEIVSTIHVWSIGFVNVCYGYFGLVCWLCQICSQLRRTKDGDPSWFFDSAAELHPSWRTQALELGRSLVRSALIRPSPKEAHPKNLVTLGSI